MANLLYITNTSLDGYIEDESGSFDWLNSDETHHFITELIRPIETHLYGRRLYESMAYWGAAPVDSYLPEQRNFAAVWHKAQKIVYSRTLAATTTSNTRLEHDFNPEDIRKIKQKANTDIFIGGAELASLAIEADLVDECHVFIYPVIVGRGKPAFRAPLRRSLELIATKRFAAGVVHHHYRIKPNAVQSPQ